MMRKSPNQSAVALFILASLTGFLGVGTSADSTIASRPLLMGAMGDSLTAATMADVPIPSIERSPEEQFQNWEKDHLRPESVFENKYTLSWATGIHVKSQLLMLRQYLAKAGDPRPLYGLNVSFPGNETSDLLGQASQLVSAMKTGKYDALKYVTLMIGPNDICGEKIPTVEQRRKNLMAAFQKLAEIKQNEPIRVLVPNVPRIPDLAFPEINNGKTILGLTCREVRNQILNFCNPLLIWKTPGEYEKDIAIVEEMNDLLQSVVDEVNRTYPGKIEAFYSGRVFETKLTRDILAGDCFHPNPDGHELLAAEMWQDQPWFK